MAVYSKLYGRTGNQLFQKAAAIGYAMKHGLQYDTTPRTRFSKYAIRLAEVGHQYQELSFDENWRGFNDIVLDGYFQSAKYFDHCREEVLKAFGFTWELKPGWCSIHVRRGDYLKYPDKHPVVTMDYLTQAIEMMSDQRGIEKFMVFSDDLPWCMENFRGLPYDFLFSLARTDIEDLIEGSCCEHNIISNSTFSWWQAWLNRNPDKTVISPSKDNWFGAGNANLCTDDIIPESWIQIKY
jgi:hypothetical protein